MKRTLSDAAAKCAERWSRVQYGGSEPVETERAERKTVGSDADTDIEGDSDEDLVVVGEKKVEVHVLSDSEPDIEDARPSKRIKGTDGYVPFRLIRSEAYDESTGHTPYMADLGDIFGDPELREVYLFSFQYDLSFVLRHFTTSIERITIMAQTGTIVPVSSSELTHSPQFSQIFHRLVVKEIYMPPYSCHHSKMIIGIYRNGRGVRVFLPSNNFTWAETNWPQQVLWSSPFMSISDKAVEMNGFQRSLCDYLSFYKLKELNSLVKDTIMRTDFSGLADVEFIYSCPKTKGKNIETGLNMFLKSIEKVETELRDVDQISLNLFLCQSSTIGGPIGRRKDNPSNLFTHVIVPTARGFSEAAKSDQQALLKAYHENKTYPCIIYPCMKEIRDASVGINSAGWFNFNYTRNDTQLQQYDWLRNKIKVFYKYNRDYTTKQRLTTPSHTKFYLRFRMPSQSMAQGMRVPEHIDWCLFTSANLSSNAWGTLGSQPRNYEVGVMYKNSNITTKAQDSNLHCQSLQDIIYRKGQRPQTRSVLFPFPSHLQPYETNDQAFYQM